MRSFSPGLGRGGAGFPGSAAATSSFGRRDHFLLLLVVGIGGYGWFLSSKVDRNLAHEDLFGSSAEQTETTQGKKLVTDKGTNYLLIGSDARPGETASRSDVIQLVHVTEARDEIWIIHFPRDLYVPVPGHGEDKINAAYAYGQSPLLVRTIQDLVGVKIDHIAKTDFEGFKNLTDALGGVRVNNQQASPKYPAGPVDLDGEQALEYVRERKTLADGDISRGQRQQEISAVIGELHQRRLQRRHRENAREDLYQRVGHVGRDAPGRETGHQQHEGQAHAGVDEGWGGHLFLVAAVRVAPFATACRR